MEKFVVKDFDFDITEDELLRTLRITEGPSNEDFQKSTEMLKEALNCSCPKFVYCIAPIERKEEDAIIVDGQRFVSSLVRKNLDKVHRIVPYVATCGTEADSWAAQYTDMIEHFWADEIKQMILEKCIDVMHKTIKMKFFPARDMSSMSPGSLSEWPVTAQTTLFSLIGEVKKDVGVILTDSCLMIPSKSVSGFFFSSEIHFENCQLCSMKNCPGRRAAYLGN
jgi:hypothetical protein